MFSQTYCPNYCAGDETIVRENARSQGIEPGGVAVIDHRRAADFEKMAAFFHELRRAKGLMADEARTMVADPLYYGNLMVRLGSADGSVAGATNTTSHTVRAALHCIGVRSGFKLVSSFFLMTMHNTEFGHDGAMIFADCGVVIDPSAAELAEIALASADSFRALLGTEPRVAMLSFSTKGSAKHKLVDKVVEATRTIRARAPELLVDGELQADAAIVAALAQSKAPGSAVAGRANTLISGSAVGNISYKLPSVGCATTIGPILQGSTNPQTTCRGCKAEDIVNAVAITAVQARAESPRCWFRLNVRTESVRRGLCALCVLGVSAVSLLMNENSTAETPRTQRGAEEKRFPTDPEGIAHSPLRQLTCCTGIQHPIPENVMIGFAHRVSLATHFPSAFGAFLIAAGTVSARQQKNT